jgi:hypothetical protein
MTPRGAHCSHFELLWVYNGQHLGVQISDVRLKTTIFRSKHTRCHLQTLPVVRFPNILVQNDGNGHTLHSHEKNVLNCISDTAHITKARLLQLRFVTPINRRDNISFGDLRAHNVQHDIYSQSTKSVCHPGPSCALWIATTKHAKYRGRRAWRFKGTRARIMQYFLVERQYARMWSSRPPPFQHNRCGMGDHPPSSWPEKVVR